MCCLSQFNVKLKYKLNNEIVYPIIFTTVIKISTNGVWLNYFVFHTSKKAKQVKSVENNTDRECCRLFHTTKIAAKQTIMIK